MNKFTNTFYKRNTQTHIEAKIDSVLYWVQIEFAKNVKFKSLLYRAILLLALRFLLSDQVIIDHY